MAGQQVEVDAAMPKVRLDGLARHGYFDAGCRMKEGFHLFDRNRSNLLDLRGAVAAARAARERLAENRTEAAL